MKPTSELTDEELRITLAGLLGWREQKAFKFEGATHYDPADSASQKVYQLYPDGTPAFLPDWPSDLNAVHEAEKALGFHDAGKFGVFNKKAYEYWKQLKNIEPYRLYATARQRTEALVEVLRKREAEMLWLKIQYRSRYWWRKLCNAFGFCPCGTIVNWTTTGRPICPKCGK